MKQSTKLFICFVIIILACVSCILWYMLNTQTIDIPQKPIRIGLTPWPGWAHAYVAKEIGLFKKYNVNVELVLIPEYTKQQQLFKDGELDGNFSLYPDVILMNNEGISSIIVYVADYSEGGDVIIGIPELDSLADVKGKIVSFEGINSFSHLFVLEALKNSGLREEDVFYENIPGNEIINALDTQKIIAGHTWSPTKEQAIHKGYKVLTSSKEIHCIIVDVLVFNSKIIKERPKEIELIIKALLEANQYVYSQHKDDAIKIMAKAENMSEEDVRAGLDEIYQLDINGQAKVLQDTNDERSLYRCGKIIIDFYFNKGQLSEFSNLDSIIDPTFIQRLNK